MTSLPLQSQSGDYYSGLYTVPTQNVATPNTASQQAGAQQMYGRAPPAPHAVGSTPGSFQGASSSASHLHTSASQPYSSFVNHYNSQPRTLPVPLLLLRDFPLLVVTMLCQLFLMLRILVFHIPLYLLVIHMGNKCLPHRMLQLSGQLEIIHFLVKTPLSAIRPRFHLHHHDSTTSSRVFQDTVLFRGQPQAFHQPKTI